MGYEPAATVAEPSSAYSLVFKAFQFYLCSKNVPFSLSLAHALAHVNPPLASAVPQFGNFGTIKTRVFT
jgi:hypothetical protein